MGVNLHHKIGESFSKRVVNSFTNISDQEKHDFIRRNDENSRSFRQKSLLFLFKFIISFAYHIYFAHLLEFVIIFKRNKKLYKATSIYLIFIKTKQKFTCDGTLLEQQ